MCLSKYEVVLYTIFVQGTRRGGGGSWGSNKIIVSIACLYTVYIRKLYWFIQCNAVYINYIQEYGTKLYDLNQQHKH